MEKELHNILERFPQYRNKIIELYGSNGDFKTLATDYLYCRSMLVLFKQQLTDADICMENEYKAVCLDLEEDILHFLNISKKS